MKTVNDDIVFWWRNTKGLQYNAEIEGSSGNGQYINDFKLVHTSDVCNKVRSSEISHQCLWTPDEKNLKKKIAVCFKENVNIKQISIYENFMENNDILDLKIDFCNETTIFTGELNHSGAESIFYMSKE